MIISVINHTDGQISDEALQTAIRAINRQIAEDFQPYWSIGATVRLEGRGEKALDPRGDAIIYVWSGSDVDEALDHHDQNARGMPYGFVFTELAKSLDEPWSVTLSHEALELLADPQVNLLVMGPHSDNASKTAFHWYEMSDAVQSQTYDIDGVKVSNFVLPLYFTGSDEPGGPSDFLGAIHANGAPNAFGGNPRRYAGFYNPGSGGHETFARPRDTLARKRLKLKGDAVSAGARRYNGFAASEAAIPRATAPMAATDSKSRALDVPGKHWRTGI